MLDDGRKLMSTGLYKVCLVPGDLLYDEEGYTVAAGGVRVDVAMEVKIRGYANYQRVICELAVAREGWLRIVRFGGLRGVCCGYGRIVGGR